MCTLFLLQTHDFVLINVNHFATSMPEVENFKVPHYAVFQHVLHTSGTLAFINNSFFNYLNAVGCLGI